MTTTTTTTTITTTTTTNLFPISYCTHTSTSKINLPICSNSCAGFWCNCSQYDQFSEPVSFTMTFGQSTDDSLDSPIHEFIVYELCELHKYFRGLFEEKMKNSDNQNEIQLQYHPPGNRQLTLHFIVDTFLLKKCEVYKFVCEDYLEKFLTVNYRLTMNIDDEQKNVLDYSPMKIKISGNEKDRIY